MKCLPSQMLEWENHAQSVIWLMANIKLSLESIFVQLNVTKKLLPDDYRLLNSLIFYILNGTIKYTPPRIKVN